jgi:hypothetical protein
MVDAAIFAMVIASAISLLILGPGRAQREALRALRDYDEARYLRTDGRSENVVKPAIG